MSTLAEKLMLSKQQMTQLIHRLESLGYIAREADEMDRRKVLLQITEKANALIEQNTQLYLHDFNKKIDRLSSKEVKQLTCAMKTVNRLLDQLHQE